MPAVPSRRIVILGAGFAGLALATALNRILAGDARSAIHATLINTSPFGVLSPLLPGVLSGWVEPWHLAVPLQPSFPSLHVVCARAVAVDPVARTLRLDSPGTHTGCDPQSLPFDDLIFAIGATSSEPAPSGAGEFALPLRNLNDAVRIRNRLADALDAASGEESARRRRALLTVAVVGGDARACAAALEVAAALRQSAAAWPRIEPVDPRVLLVTQDAAPCAYLGDSASAACAAMLQRAGVEVRTTTAIDKVAPDHVMLLRAGSPAERADLRTLVWNVDRAPSPCLASFRSVLADQARLPVDDLERVAGSSNVFALGSCAIPGETTPARIIAQAKRLARALTATAQDRHASPASPGIGPVLLHRYGGILSLGSQRFDGALAACAARSVILSVVPGLLHRLAVRASWMAGSLGGQGLGNSMRLLPSLQPMHLTAAPPQVRPASEG